MGVLYQNISRKNLIRELIQNDIWRTYDPAKQDLLGPDLYSARTVLTYCLRGNILWTVEHFQSQTANKLFIGCYSLKGFKGRWGYKDMDESMHPYYYSCPLQYLQMVPDREDGVNHEWRQKVREYHRSNP